MRNFDKTWIKLPRSFTSWRWYHESKMVHLFLYLLLQANVKKKDYLSLTIYPGQVVTSLVQIAQDTVKGTERSVYKALCPKIG